jgi:ElaB/YqjD/DUF883 family membrane-anchored ribosome-binding protein
MGENNSTVDETDEAAEACQGSGQSTGFEYVKNSIADKLNHIAEALSEKAGDSDAQSGMGRENPASALLNQSAEYVRQFDYEREKDRIREYIGQNPGRCLLMAGGAGLIIGAILRRR